METMLSLGSILAVLAIGVVSPGPNFLLVARLHAKGRIDRVCGVVFSLLGVRLLLAAR